MNDRSEKLLKVQQLTWAMLDDQLDSSGRAELEELLFGDPEACELYLNLTTLDAHLGREHGGVVPVAGPPAGLEPASHPATVDHSPRRILRIRPARLVSFTRFAVAASVLLVTGVVAVFAWRVGQPTDSPNACATLVEARGVEWAECSARLQVGDRLVPSTVGLNRGSIVIRFDNGATATLAGPAELLIESRKSAELKRGNVLLRAERETAGFTLRTASSDYVDLGTEFGVSVNEDASSEVHVFEGVVIARPRGSDLVIPVLRNEAGRVEADRGDLVTIPVSASRFAGVTTVALATRPATQLARGPISAEARIVFLGDRATDNETHLHLIAQAFRRVFDPLDHPKLFNAGVTMPLRFEETDYRRCIVPLGATHAVIEFGPEMAANPQHRRTAAGFEAEMRRLIDRLATDGIEPILATGQKLGDRQAQCQPVLDDYNRVIRKLAAEKGCRLADVDAHCRSLEKCRLSLVAGNGAAPTFGGYQQMASVLLSAMGHGGQRVDPTVHCTLLPGVVTQWKYRLKSAADRLDTAAAGALVPDETADCWDTLVLPQPVDQLLSRVPDVTHSSTYRDRERGFATDLCPDRGQIVEAIAVIESADTRPAYLNTGASVKAVWLNGEPVFNSQGRWTGWHAGKERIPVTLRPGPNRLIVEAGNSFFISITDEYDWSVQ